MQITATRPLADSAITFELDSGASARAAGRVRAALHAVEAAIAAGELPGAVEVAGAFASITLHYDPLQGRQSQLIDAVHRHVGAAEVTEQGAGRLWRLPCCYEGDHGADLDELSARLKLPVEEIVAAHSCTELTVYAMGFLPGLPFLGDLPKDLALPRRESPRQRVPQGSVAIAKGLSVIYPGTSPGGWHIVGHCPLPLFDARREDPALLAPGDRVRFQRVSLEEHDDIAAGLAEGRIAPDDYQDTAEAT